MEDLSHLRHIAQRQVFADLVNAELLPIIAPLGFVVVDSEVAHVFDNARVDLQAPELRLRAIRERGCVWVNVGPVSEPGTWFDPDLILIHLGLASITQAMDREPHAALRGAGQFVVTMWKDLAAMCAPDQLAATKRALNAIAHERAKVLWG